MQIVRTHGERDMPIIYLVMFGDRPMEPEKSSNPEGRALNTSNIDRGVSNNGLKHGQIIGEAN